MTKNFKTISILSVLMLSWLIGANNSSAATLATTLKGKILLQVEQNGEAWYVNPVNELRYYLGRPDDAFNIMRELGLGISNKDFDSFNGYAPSRLSGRILLKVADSGKAYYVNTNDLKMYYLGRPADAFNVMRELGLGITDKNLSLISIAGTADWKTYTNASQGFSFKYPEKLSTSFIHAQTWPPSVKITTGAFSCNPTGETVRPGELKIRKTTTNPVFCVESRGEGTAGTTYVDYFYTVLYNAKLITFNFAIGYSDCGVFDNPTACNQERAKFDSDSIISQIFSTFKFTGSVDVTANWKTFATEPGPTMKFQIKYPTDWGVSDLRFPCKDVSAAVLGVISPSRSNLPGYLNISVAYLVQFCVSAHEPNAILTYQGFIRAPLSSQPTEKDKILLSSKDLENNNEYLTAKQIISSQAITTQTNSPLGQ